MEDKLFVRTKEGEGYEIILTYDFKALPGKLKELGFEPLGSSPTNQVFIRVPASLYHELTGRGFGGFWSLEPDGTYVIRFVTDWSSREEDVQLLLDILAQTGENRN